RLAERQFLRALPEVPLGCRFDANVPVRVRNLVQVPLEDVLLRVVLAQFERVHDLAELAVQRSLRRETAVRVIRGVDARADVDVLDELLGDRRTTRTRANTAADVVLPRRARKATE